MHCVSIGCIEDEIEVWMDEDTSPASNYAELLHNSTIHPQTSVLVTWICIFVQFLHFKYGISDPITSSSGHCLWSWEDLVIFVRASSWYNSLTKIRK